MPSSSPFWIITGAGGQLGSNLLRELTSSGEEATGIASPTGPRPHVGKTVALDLTDSAGLRACIEKARPTFIIHAAAVTSIQAAYENPDLARRVNVDVTAELTRHADQIGARLVLISTDLVFDGTGAPYSESAPTSPLSHYGRTKAEAEQRALAGRRTAVIRFPLLYGIPAVPRSTTFLSQLEAIRDGRPLRLFHDEFRSPLYLVDAAQACIEVAHSDFTGVLHAGGPERLSRYDMGIIAAEALGKSSTNLFAVSQTDFAASEPRPKDVSLDSSLYSTVFGHSPGRPMRQAIHDVFGELPTDSRDR